VNDVVRVIDALDLPRVHLVGTCFGGAVAACAAKSRPGVVVSVAAIGSAIGTGGVGSLEDR
jgi:pimeloyl-ACP methyl ester carboxylesterase